ncbi:MAG: phosphatase PAP2 family protein [Peptococcaceae bacterium]|nr:phosphatase PAP2 family protein [Peptococcaceae bacterium]
MRSEKKIDSKSKKMFGITAGLFLLFIVFTLMVLVVDVQPIGPEESKVGFATINQSVFGCLGVNILWYEITDWLGLLAVLFALFFAVLGLVQLVKRKNLWKVDYEIILLGMFYILVAVSYLFFEIAIVNYRPVMMDNSLEASYPSSHAMIVICIMATAMIEFRKLFADKKALRAVLNTVSAAIILITVIGRLLSGVHWFTDIIAGVLLS